MSRKLLCAVYAVIALVALVATWSQNISFFRSGGSFLGFWEATKINPASRSITVDIALFLLAAAILMVIEARKHGVKFEVIWTPTVLLLVQLVPTWLSAPYACGVRSRCSCGPARCTPAALLHQVPVSFIAFDVLAADGTDVTGRCRIWSGEASWTNLLVEKSKRIVVPRFWAGCHYHRNTCSP